MVGRRSLRSCSWTPGVSLPTDNFDPFLLRELLTWFICADTSANAKQPWRKQSEALEGSTSSSAALAKVSQPVSPSTDTKLTAIAVVGAVEELTTSERSRTLVKGQIETNFFGPTNIIKAALPAMREKRTGHIIVLTGISTSEKEKGVKSHTDVFQRVTWVRRDSVSTAPPDGPWKVYAMYVKRPHWLRLAN